MARQRKPCGSGVCRLEMLESRTLLSMSPGAPLAARPQGAATLLARAAGFLEDVAHRAAQPPGATAPALLPVKREAGEQLPSKPVINEGGPVLGPVVWVTTHGVALKNITINWGDGTATSQGTIRRGPAGEYVVSGVHRYEAAGEYSVTTTATEVETGLPVTRKTRVAAHDESFPPTFEFVGPFFDPRYFERVAGLRSYRLVVPEKPVVTLAVGNIPFTELMIDWGDGSAPTPGASRWVGHSIETLTPATALSGELRHSYVYEGHNHVYATAGTYTITFTGRSLLEDPEGHPDGLFVYQMQVEVKQNSREGETYSGVVQEPITIDWTFSIWADLQLAGSIDWGDGTIEEIEVPRIDFSQGRLSTFHVFAQHTYAEEGTYRVIVLPRPATSTNRFDAVVHAYSTAVIEPMAAIMQD